MMKGIKTLEFMIWIAAALTVLAVMILAYLLVIQYCWNNLFHEVFNLPSLTIWQIFLFNTFMWLMLPNKVVKTC